MQELSFSEAKNVIVVSKYGSRRFKKISSISISKSLGNVDLGAVDELHEIIIDIKEDYSCFERKGFLFIF